MRRATDLAAVDAIKTKAEFADFMARTHADFGSTMVNGIKIC